MYTFNLLHNYTIFITDFIYYYLFIIYYISLPSLLNTLFIVHLFIIYYISITSLLHILFYLFTYLFIT